MHLIWVFLALGPLLLFGLVAATYTECARLAVMRAFLWFALVSLAGAEGLGAFGAISTPAVRVYWFAVSAGCGTLLVFRLHQGRRIFWGKPRLLASAPYGWWILLSSAITLFIAATVVPNTWDSLSYHLPKVEHWLQNGTLAFYPSHDPLRQNDLGPMAEIMMLQWRAVTDGDHLAALVQWLAMVGSLGGVSLIAAQLGGSFRAQLLSMLFCATLPIGILQSTGTANDYVVTFFLIAFIERLVAARGQFEASILAEAALSIAFAILTKPTAIIWGLPFGTWFAASLIWQPRRAAVVLGLFVVVAVLPGLGHNGRLLKTYGTPVPPLNKIISSASFGLSQTMDSLLLHSASEFAVPQDRVNTVMLLMINRLSAALGWSEHRAETVVQIYPLRLPGELWLQTDGTASNPLHYGITIASVIASMWWLVHGRARALGFYSLCCIVGFLLFVSLIRWQPFVTRLHLPIVVALSPVVGVVGGEMRRSRPLVEFLALTLCVGSWPLLVENQFRPLWPHSYLSDNPIKTMFAWRPDLLGPYKTAIGRIRDTRCRQVALLEYDENYNNLEAWEYPFWHFLHDDLARGGRIEDVFPGQPPVAYPLGPFHPRCIVVMKHEEPSPPLEYDGVLWTEAYRAGPIVVYEKGVHN
jgi:hypothetical protein